MESGPTKKPRAASSRRRLGPSTPRTPREAHRHHPDAVPTPAPLSVCPQGSCFCTRGCVMDSAIPRVHAPRRHHPALHQWGTGCRKLHAHWFPQSVLPGSGEGPHYNVRYNVLRYVNSLHYCGTLLHVGMRFTGYITKALHGHLDR